MPQIGKFLFLFAIASICFAGALSIFSMQMSTPIPIVNLGDTDVYTNVSSGVNVTGELLANTGSYGLGASVIILFILSAIIVLMALALVGRKHR